MDKDTVTVRQDAFILKLIEVGSIAGACKALRMPRKTYYEWAKDVGFKARLRELRERVIGETLDRLTLLTGDALKAYEDGLRPSEEINLRLRAANSVMEHLTKIRETAELEERIAQLEERLEAKERGGYH